MKLTFHYDLLSVATLARIGAWLNRPHGRASTPPHHAPPRGRLPRTLPTRVHPLRVVLPLPATACGSNETVGTGGDSMGGGAGGGGTGTTGASAGQGGDGDASSRSGRLGRRRRISTPPSAPRARHLQSASTVPVA